MGLFPPGHLTNIPIVRVCFGFTQTEYVINKNDGIHLCRDNNTKETICHFSVTLHNQYASVYHNNIIYF